MFDTIRQNRSAARLALPALALCAATVLAACRPGAPSYHRTLYTFGTLAGLTLEASHADEARAVADALEKRLATLNRDWYAWGDGELGQLNRELATRDEVTLSPELAALIRRAVQLRDATGGRFDPTVGPAVELWGLHSDEATPSIPPAAAIAAATGGVDLNVIDAAGRPKLTVAEAGLVVDLGGIAKGAALAECLRIMRERDIIRGIVDLGGDLIVFDRDGKRPARVGIRDPRGDGLLGVIEAANGEAVVTSGDYERYFENDGERFHHIIDPETGAPAAAAAIAATVISHDPILADALATALIVAGPGELTATAERLGVESALIVDANGELHLTTAMRERLH